MRLALAILVLVTPGLISAGLTLAKAIAAGEPWRYVIGATAVVYTFVSLVTAICFLLMAEALDRGPGDGPIRP